MVEKISQADTKLYSEFAFTTAKKMQAEEFGNRRTKARPVREVARDIMIGKVAEGAVSQFLGSRLGIDLPVNLEVYGKGIGDREDFIVNGHKIEIKASRYGARWLLISEFNLVTRRDINQLFDSVLMAIVDWNRETDKFDGQVRLMGYILLDDICNLDKLGEREMAKTPARYLPEGTLLPGTGMILQANNLGIHVDNLYADWNRYMEILCQESILAG